MKSNLAKNNVVVAAYGGGMARCLLVTLARRKGENIEHVYAVYQQKRISIKQAALAYQYQQAS